jgi:hypothetical protein
VTAIALLFWWVDNSNKNNSLISNLSIPRRSFLNVAPQQLLPIVVDKLQLSRILAINYLLTLPSIAQMQRILVSLDQG